MRRLQVIPTAASRRHAITAEKFARARIDLRVCPLEVAPKVWGVIVG